MATSVGNETGGPGHDPAGQAPRGYVVTWTEAPGCESPAPDLQDRAQQLAWELDRAAHLREPLRIHLSTGHDTYAEPQAGDIGLRDRSTVIDNSLVEAADVLLGDGAALTRLIARAVPWNELAGRLAHLIRTYQVERCGRDTFATWARGLSDSELRERLGLARAEFDRVNISPQSIEGTYAGRTST